MTEQRLLEIEYELLKHRGMQVSESTPSQKLLHHYSALQKDLEDDHQRKLANKNRIVMGRGGPKVRT